MSEIDKKKENEKKNEKEKREMRGLVYLKRWRKIENRQKMSVGKTVAAQAKVAPSPARTIGSHSVIVSSRRLKFCGINVNNKGMKTNKKDGD